MGREGGEKICLPDPQLAEIGQDEEKHPRNDEVFAERARLEQSGTEREKPEENNEASSFVCAGTSGHFFALGNLGRRRRRKRTCERFA